MKHPGALSRAQTHRNSGLSLTHEHPSSPAIRMLKAPAEYTHHMCVDLLPSPDLSGLMELYSARDAYDGVWCRLEAPD